MKKPIYLMALPIVLLSHSLGSAQDTPKLKVEGRPQIIANLYNCRDIADPALRLACYDREVAAVEQAEGANELVIADREQVREARRGLFGFSLPRIGLFDGVDDNEGEEIERLETTLQTAVATGGGKWLFVLEDGARWMQTDSTPILGRPKGGDPIVIEQGAMGGYMAKISSKRAFRVKRIN